MRMTRKNKLRKRYKDKKYKKERQYFADYRKSKEKNRREES